MKNTKKAKSSLTKVNKYGIPIVTAAVRTPKSPAGQSSSPKRLKACSNATLSKPSPPSEQNERETQFELEATAAEIQELSDKIKNLHKYYKVKSKIGQGSFSTVFKAVDVRHDQYRNDEWQAQLVAGRRISKSNRNDRRAEVLNKYVALKRVHSTSSPERIISEITILNELRGCPCITPLITAFRQGDEFFIVMPFIEHDDFRKIYATIEMIDIKHYLKSLLTALYHLHKRKIIHRDVKPSNFLYSQRLKTGVLIDFGLAQKLETPESPPTEPTSRQQSQLSSQSAPHPHNQSSSLPLSQPSSQPLSPSLSKQFVSVSQRLSQTSIEIANKRMSQGRTEAAYRNKENKSTAAQRSPAPGLPGYITPDTRKALRANRAGTRGFRAPEVLLRQQDQTEAIDIWSAGVILLSILSGRYPFFLANDDSDGLIEIATIFGYEEVKAFTEKIGRTIVTNIPTLNNDGLTLLEVCKYLNPKQLENWDKNEVDLAIDLLKACLTVDSTLRITAKDALNHPFLAE